jgi:hypothetical protein
LTPGDNFFVPGTDEGVKVYVLGPPTDFNLLKTMNPKAGDAVEGLAALNELDETSSFLLGALENISDPEKDAFSGPGFPFSKRYMVPIEVTKQVATAATDGAETKGKASDGEHPLNVWDIYNDREKDWRQINTDWLSDIGRLALYIDTLTNNTSLVLAFELVDSGKVLLFVGDAQIGNWKSWFDVKFKDSDVTAEDLLKRTVLYKAGHHSSHNATYKKGLELMNEKELVIMVPLNQEVSDKYHFLMGKEDMITGYHRKAQGRVVRTDTIFQDTSGFANDHFHFAKKVEDIPGMSLEPVDVSLPTKPQMSIVYTVEG